MVLPSLADAIIVIVLVVPGFISFFIMCFIGSYGKKLSDFQRTTWSFIFSVVVLFPFTAITGQTNLDKIRDEFFYPTNFMILFGLTIGIGICSGVILRRVRKPRVLSDPWKLAMTSYRSNTNVWIKVITKTGQEYIGKLRAVGLFNRKELIMSSPEQIIRDVNGNITNRMIIFEEVLFREDDIARVFFNTMW